MLTKIKNAFTMIELIFVIIILGIVSSIGASLIANVYESYIVQRALHRATVKTDLAVKQIATRLSYRITPSVIGKRLDGVYLPIDQVIPGNTYRILEWFGYDNDSFSAATKPGWSGFCDKTPSTATNLVTPGSKLSTTTTILGNLGGNVSDAAIIFNAPEYSHQGTVMPYHPNTMGYAGAGTATTISPVGGFPTDESITITDNVSPKSIYDQYKLTWSAYAIVPVQQADDPDTTVDESQLFKLVLYYNYQPWLGDTYTNGLSSTLLEDVTVFKYRGVGNTIHFKLCVQEKISGDETVNICKEKAVIR